MSILLILMVLLYTPSVVSADEPTWTVYTKDDGLLSNWCFTLQFDLYNNLWAGVDGVKYGVSFFNGKEWSIKFPKTRISEYAITVDRFNRVLISMTYSFIRYDGSDVMQFDPYIPEVYAGYIVAIYVDDKDRIWVSGAGDTWSMAYIARYTNDEKDYQIQNYANTFTPDKYGTLWATNGHDFMYFQENDSTWNEYYVAGVDFPVPEERYYQIEDMLFDSGNTLWCAFLGVGVMKYDGETWTIYTPENSGLPFQNTFCVTLDHNENLWIGTEAGLARFDRENDWQVFDTSNSGLPHNIVRDVAVAYDNTIWIATEGGGVAKYTGDIITAIDEEPKPEALPTVTSYPNPFNPSTTIAYSLPEGDYTRIEVFDVTGRIVETLVDEWCDIGHHTVVWDASGQAAGLYFCRVTSGVNSKVMKMMLVK